MVYRTGGLNLLIYGVVMVLGALFINLSAFSFHGHAADEEIVVAIVNKHIQITKQQLDYAVKSYEKSQKKNFTTKEEKMTLVQNLIRRQLILQLEDMAAYRNDPLIKQSVKNYEDSLIIDKYLRLHIAQRMNVSEEELKKLL